MVDGPAAVRIISGKTDVFGTSVGKINKILIREGKRIPFTVEEETSFNLKLGENASIEEVEGSTIPESWEVAFSEIIKVEERKPAVIMVLGGVDSGKTSFCTYLINKLIKKRFAVAVLDEDLGQADLGPPSTIAYTIMRKPVIDMYNVITENAYFVGVISPIDDLNRTIEGTLKLKNEIINKNVDFIIVNTDGWIEGEEALRFKTRLALSIEPHLTVCLENTEELEPLCSAIGDLKQIKIETPKAIQTRSKEKRQSFRELSYAKYLDNSKVKIYPTKRLKIDNFNIQVDKFVQGSLLGLYNSDKFLGLGVLRDYDSKRKNLKILTSIKETPSVVSIGKMRLNKKLNELKLEK